MLKQDGATQLVSRISAKLQREVTGFYQHFCAQRFGSYSWKQHTPTTCLTFRLSERFSGAVEPQQAIPDEVLTHYLEHRFDLLGSGWTLVAYGMQCRGMFGHRYDMKQPLEGPLSQPASMALLINKSNAAVAQHIASKTDNDYRPIDWQLDFKSGFRWDACQWHAKLRYGHLPGVDVKVPWELSRMQHLPQIAVKAVSSDRQGATTRLMVAEIRNQCLDFCCH